MRYQDMMDSSRTVQVEKQSGKIALCKIYFDGVYNGKAEIPTGLFETRFNPRTKTDEPLS